MLYLFGGFNNECLGGPHDFISVHTTMFDAQIAAKKFIDNNPNKWYIICDDKMQIFEER